MAWVTPEDILADWIGENAPSHDETLVRWIGRAERVVRREFPQIQERIDAGNEPDLIDTVRDVVSQMVTRVFRNPEGIRQRQETDGSFTGSITFGGDQPGILTLLPEERDALRLPSEGPSGQAFSISMNSGAYVSHLPWCDIAMGGVRCSCGAIIATHPLYEGG